MAERAILAYFHSPQEANSCVPKLKALRVVDLQVDKFGQYPGHGNDETMNPLSNSDFGGLSHLTLDAGRTNNRDARILMATSPDASGLSDGSYDFYTDDMDRRDTLLTVVVDEASYEQAVRVIEEAGGRI